MYDLTPSYTIYIIEGFVCEKAKKKKKKNKERHGETSKNMSPLHNNLSLIKRIFDLNIIRMHTHTNTLASNAPSFIIFNILNYYLPVMNVINKIAKEK